MRTSASLRRCRVSDESTCKRGYSEQLLCLTDLRAASSQFGVGGVPEECPGQVLRDGAVAASRFASLPLHFALTLALHLSTRTTSRYGASLCERTALTTNHALRVQAWDITRKARSMSLVSSPSCALCACEEKSMHCETNKVKTKPKTEITELQKPASHHHLACTQLTAPTRPRARIQGH